MYAVQALNEGQTNRPDCYFSQLLYIRALLGNQNTDPIVLREHLLISTKSYKRLFAK